MKKLILSLLALPFVMSACFPDGNTDCGDNATTVSALAFADTRTRTFTRATVTEPLTIVYAISLNGQKMAQLLNGASLPVENEMQTFAFWDMSLDGLRLLISNDAKTMLYTYDLTTRTLSSGFETTGMIMGATFSPDGAKIAYAYGSGSSIDGINIISAATGSAIASTSSLGLVCTSPYGVKLRYIPNGNYLVFSDSSNFYSMPASSDAVPVSFWSMGDQQNSTQSLDSGMDVPYPLSNSRVVYLGTRLGAGKEISTVEFTPGNEGSLDSGHYVMLRNASAGWQFGMPAASADGTTIAYIQYQPVETESGITTAQIVSGTISGNIFTTATPVNMPSGFSQYATPIMVGVDKDVFSSLTAVADFN